jgi:hypothetical protein
VQDGLRHLILGVSQGQAKLPTEGKAFFTFPEIQISILNILLALQCDVQVITSAFVLTVLYTLARV